MPYNGNELANEKTISNDKDDVKDNFDVAFIVSEVGYDKSQLEGICNEIKAISEIVFERSDDVTISVYGLDGSGNTQSEWYGRADSIENVKVMLEKIKPKKIQNQNKVVTISDCIDYVTLAHKNTESAESRNRAEYSFLFFDPLYEELDGIPAFEYVGSSSRSTEYGMAVLESINKDGTDIDFSTITSYFQTIEERRSSYVKLLSYKTGGINIDGISFENVVQKSIEHIYGEEYSPTTEYSMGVLATNWKEVKLKAPITYKYYDLSTRDDLTIDDIEMYDCVDTDDDGLYDFQEIMFRYNGRDTMIFESTDDDAEIIKQYTLRELSEKTNAESIYKMPVYVENALLGMDEWSAEYQEFITTPLIFIYSDPTSGDGDGDGISDPEDIMPLVTLNYKSTKFSEFVDTAEFFEIRFILECQLMKGYTADECVDCIEILRKYTDTNNVEAFQQEMISAGLVSPNAAAPATWFDKIFWYAWAENESAPLLDEYENYSKNTSFEELFEQNAEQWSESAKFAVEIWAFGITERYIQYMQNWHRITITDDFETVCKIKEKIDNGENVNPLADVEQPYTGNRTLPSSNQSNEPRGQRSQKKSAGDQCENIAADVLAKNGYDIEFLLEDSRGPQKGNGYGISSNSNPDYLIEGRAFDCYAPQGNNVDSILKEMRKKTKNQSDRLVLYFSKTNEKVPNALTFTPEQVNELLIKILSRAHSNDSKLGSLKELIVIYEDEIYPAIWY